VRPVPPLTAGQGYSTTSLSRLCQHLSLPPGCERNGWRAGPRRRSFRWRVPLRWYLISLLAPLLILLIAVMILYGFAPLRTLGQNWLLLFTAFLPALAIMILLNNVAGELGWTGFVFTRFQDRHGPLRAALLTTVFFWLFHVPSFCVETRSWATTALCWASSCCRIWAAD
jgi:membrane protease YdiL (CAAX protease family)